MPNKDAFYYGQGRVSLAEIDAVTGALGKWSYRGDMSAFSFKMASEEVKHTECNSGQLGTVRNFPIKPSATVDMTVHQIDTENLAMGMRGKVVSTTGSTVTAEALQAGLAVGDTFYLANPGVTNVVITDSTATPKTLQPNVDYVVEDPAFGRCRLINVGTYTQPFKAAYTYGARKEVGMFTTAQKNYALRYEGVNLAEGNAPVMVDLYKVSPGLLQQLDMITTGTEVAGMAITGSVLQDTSKPMNGPLGQYGKITQIALATT